MFSIVDFYGKQSNYSCGYCKHSSSCQSHGMWAHTMTADDYQNLIDRGWRRSGCYCYKPEMSTTCCPSYTIKCDAMNFKLNKSHKKIIKRMNKFLKDGIKSKDHCEDSEQDGHGCEISGDMEMGDVSRNPRNSLNISDIDLVPSEKVDLEAPQVARAEQLRVSKNSQQSGASNLPSNSPTDGTNLQPKKAKLLRVERKREKLMRKGLNVEEIEQKMQGAKGKNVEKSLEVFLDEAPKEDEDAAHRLKVKLVPSSEGATDLVFRLYCSYQVAIHQDLPSKLKMDRYKRFLVKSPLKFTTGQNTPSCGLGSFHQQYWLDNRLIAVGVIDILSHCVSSVYFFYDPAYRFLSLGTYGSLREIAFTRKLQQQLAGISNYYMGFYIHSCPKMRYKSNLSPSYLLCPEVYTWHPLNESIIKKLNQNKYARLNGDSKATDQSAVKTSDLLHLLVLYGNTYMRYSSYMEMKDFTDPEEIVVIYSKLVGKACISRMLLYRG
ncbi:arginyl-tRNA--protein transferase 1 isoform X2 [Wyeomyia smithii]|uniref:arginyl-tRNA--protein transferase 1 isoform X2 n=1 Tax=Wyeomyia smithii TaxID=174621 RepID=UPI002467DA70|nr:arginyl-tRNA--protein transferase 1 isoform X2 [Wyeomyia smithii]